MNLFTFSLVILAVFLLTGIRIVYEYKRAVKGFELFMNTKEPLNSDLGSMFPSSNQESDGSSQL